MFGSGHAAGTHNSCDSCSSAGHWDVQHQGRGKALSSRAHLQLSTGSRPLVPLHCTCPAWWAAGYTHCHTTATVTMPLLAAWPSNLYPLVGPPVRLDPASGSAGAIWKRGPRYPATGGALVAKMPRAPSCNRDVRTAWPLAGARALPTLAAGPVAGVSQPPMDAIVGGAKRTGLTSPSAATPVPSKTNSGGQASIFLRHVLCSVRARCVDIAPRTLECAHALSCRILGVVSGG